MKMEYTFTYPYDMDASEKNENKINVDVFVFNAWSALNHTSTRRHTIKPIPLSISAWIYQFKLKSNRLESSLKTIFERRRLTPGNLLVILLQPVLL